MSKVVKHFFLNKTYMHDKLLDIHPSLPQSLDCCFIEIQTLLAGAQQGWSFLQTAYWHKHGFSDSTTVSTLIQNHDPSPRHDGMGCPSRHQRLWKTSGQFSAYTKIIRKDRCRRRECSLHVFPEENVVPCSITWIRRWHLGNIFNIIILCI